MAERIVRGDARAEQWRRLGRGKIVGDGSERLDRRDHVVGIAAVVGHARHLGDNAEDEITAQAIGASTAMAAVPADAHALPEPPARNPGPSASIWPAISWPGTAG
jgi:hypothetical protein